MSDSCRSGHQLASHTYARPSTLEQQGTGESSYWLRAATTNADNHRTLKLITSCPLKLVFLGARIASGTLCLILQGQTTVYWNPQAPQDLPHHAGLQLFGRYRQHRTVGERRPAILVLGGAVF